MPDWREPDKRKQSLYFPHEMLLQIQHEAGRLDRSLSWVMQQAWKIAFPTIASFPDVDDRPLVATDEPSEKLSKAQ